MERIRMDRVNAILKHKTYRKYYDQIEKIEKDTDRDFFMSAEKAVEYGLIDKVLESRSK